MNKFKLINLSDVNYLIIISILIILLRIFIYDLTITPIERQSYDSKNLSIIQDISKGLGFFIYMPIILFFSKYLYDSDKFEYKFIYIGIYFIALIFISFSTNSRSIIFDPIFLILIITFVLYLFNRIKLKEYYFRIILICILALPIANFFEKISSNLAYQRSFAIERTPIENVIEVVTSIASNENKNFLKFNQEFTTKSFFGEDYYNNSLFNRLNILLVNDNFIYIKKNISKNQIEIFKELQKNKIIAIIPQPLINLFTNNFNKRDYLYSTASIFYKKFSEDDTSLSIGSSLISLYIIFDKWIFLICTFIFIPFFLIFDFFMMKKKYISPYILIFFFYYRLWNNEIFCNS